MDIETVIGDAGFVEGEVVSYSFSPHTMRKGPILNISEGEATFSDVVLPLISVFKLATEPMQFSLFE